MHHISRRGITAFVLVLGMSGVGWAAESAGTTVQQATTQQTSTPQGKTGRHAHQTAHKEPRRSSRHHREAKTGHTKPATKKSHSTRSSTETPSSATNSASETH